MNDFVLLRKAAWVAFTAYAIALASFSIYQVLHFALAEDYAIAYGAFYNVSHGNLNPRLFGPHFIDTYVQDHFAVFIYVIALLGRIAPGPYTLKLVQDAAAVGAGLLAWRWIYEALWESRERLRVRPLWVGMPALAVIVLNPWPYWADAWDFHMQMVSGFFLLAAAYAFSKRRLLFAAIFVVFALSTGDVESTYLIGLGLTLLFFRGLRIWGVATIVAGVGWYELAHRFGFGYGGQTGYYDYLILGDLGATAGGGYSVKGGLINVAFGALRHPGLVIAVLWSHAKDIFAIVAPSGVVGAFHPWAIGVAAITLLQNELVPGYLLAVPSFQSSTVFVFGALGFGLTAVALARRAEPRLAKILLGLAAANVAIWGAIWIPALPDRWVRATPEAVMELQHIARALPRADHVLATHGVVGAFADRTSDYPIAIARLAWLDAGVPTDFIVAPNTNINLESANQALATAAFIAMQPGAKLNGWGGTVWWFTLPAPATTHRILLPIESETVPGWTIVARSGVPNFTGPPSRWFAQSTGAPGYVVSQAYWRIRPGRYSADVDVETKGTALLEIVNASNHRIILKQPLRTNGLRRVVAVEFEHAHPVPEGLFSGWGPFSIDPVPAPEENQFEIRIANTKHADVRVWSVGLRPITSPLPFAH